MMTRSTVLENIFRRDTAYPWSMLTKLYPFAWKRMLIEVSELLRYGKDKRWLDEIEEEKLPGWSCPQVEGVLKQVPLSEPSSQRCPVDYLLFKNWLFIRLVRLQLNKGLVYTSVSTSFGINYPKNMHYCSHFYGWKTLNGLGKKVTCSSRLHLLDQKYHKTLILWNTTI